MSNERVRVVQLKAWGVGMMCLLTSACMQEPGTPGDGQSVALEQAAPQSISRHYYGYINPRTGEVKFSQEPFVLGEAELDFGAAGHLVPNQFGEVPLVQDGTNGTNPFNTFEIQGVGASIDNAAESAGQTQCPGSNLTLDIQMRHFFDKADFEEVFVEFTKIEPGVTHYPYDTDSIPGGLPLDNTIGVYDYGTLSDGNSNQSTRTWKFERCTDEPFIVEFAILGTCVPEAGETAISACLDNPGYKRLMASDGVSCVRSLNGAKCWGDNSHSQLTTGTFEDSAAPLVVKKEVPGRVSFLTAPSSGSNHACSVMNDTRVRCWGSNDYGQLGNGSTTNSANGVLVTSPSGQGVISSVAQVVGGESHSCALSTSGEVRCWGDNRGSQLGTGSGGGSRPDPTPVRAPQGSSGNLINTSQIAANYFTTCALLQSKEVVCWGFNRNGQAGSGSGSSEESIPAYVKFEGSNLGNIASISAGTRHVCAVSETGGAYCWGDNRFSQLGDGTSTLRETATAVVNESGTGLLAGVEEIAAGHIHTCARLTSGEARCWGNRFQLGTGSPTSSAVPVPVRNAGNTGNLTGVTSIKTRYSSTCALNSSGNVMCWGVNDSGQLGDASTSLRLLPVQVRAEGGGSMLSNVSKITVGDEFACALDSVDDFFCWGANASGQLATGGFTSSSVPIGTTLDRATLKSPLLGVTSIVGGGMHSCTLQDDSTMLCWGDNGGGQLGVGDKVDRDYPTSVRAPDAGSGNLSGVTQIVGNSFTTCALLDTQEVVCWGFNRKGQIGNGSGSDEVTPSYVVLGAGNLEDVVQISAGTQHVCAATSLGEAFCWGFNRFGQLGDASTTDRPIPVSVRGPGGVGFLTGVVSVHASNIHSCALINDGSVYCWGSSGRLGTGALGTSTVPVQVAGVDGVGTLSNVVSVSSSHRHTLALLDDGTLVGWGGNASGQIGDGTTATRLAPVKVLNEAGTSDLLDVREVSAGIDHSCAYMADRTVKCWGAGDDGQLGDGLFTSSSLPVSVTGL